jgi:CBS-domain-containing membrane protein
MMKVEQLMARNVATCRPDESLNDAARIMWEHDCGCVPVVERADGASRVVGMLTDRDISMAAYTQGRPLWEIGIASAMAKSVYSCRGTDSTRTALKILEQNQLHRLPVLDKEDHLVGILALADVAREAQREHSQEAPDVSDTQVAEVVEAISAPRAPHEVAAAA